MSEELKTQKDAILTHLKRYGRISSMTAINRYGVTRLSAVIWTLRHKDGYDILATSETRKNRFGNTTTYSVYQLRGDSNETC